MSTRRAGGHYDATMQLYVDGALLPREAAKISTFNHGLRSRSHPAGHRGPTARPSEHIQEEIQ